jgi:hypothetical protein
LAFHAPTAAHRSISSCRLSSEQQRSLMESLDEADRGELVDGPEAIAKQDDASQREVGNNKLEPA